jgi:hypothetical protein
LASVKALEMRYSQHTPRYALYVGLTSMRQRPHAVRPIASTKPLHTTVDHIGVSRGAAWLSRTNLASAKAVERQNT